MHKKLRILSLSFFLLLFAGNFSFANEDQEEEKEKVVEFVRSVITTVAERVDALNEEEKKDVGSFHKIVVEELSPHLNYEKILKTVSGKWYRKGFFTKEVKADLAEALRYYLENLYALLLSKVFDVVDPQDIHFLEATYFGKRKLVISLKVDEVRYAVETVKNKETGSWKIVSVSSPHLKVITTLRRFAQPYLQRGNVEGFLEKLNEKRDH